MAGRILTGALYLLGLLLFYSGSARLVRRLGRKNPKVLLYHDCAETETLYTADLDCTTRPSTFAAHLDYLSKHHLIVDLETIAAGRAPEHAVAITFDDGYRSVYDHAYPLLRERRLPATIYLISDVVQNLSLVWVNELNFALQHKPALLSRVREYFDLPEQASVADVISYCRLSYDVTKMQALLQALRADMDLPVQRHAAEANLYLDWSQIDEMMESNIAFGNHTRTHPNLERLNEAEQTAEIGDAQTALQERLPAIRSFAYPFGHHGPATAHLAQQLGLQSVVEVGGYNKPIRPFRIGRVHLSDQSVAGLFARMEIVEPVKGKLRDFISRRRSPSPGYA